MLNPIAKILMVLGAALIAAGLFWQFGARFFPLGRLPGDISVERGNFRFYFPVVSCIIISLILSLISRFFKG